MSCRVCDNALFTEPLLRYSGMPSRAQNLPEAHELRRDYSVVLDVRQCSGCGLVQLSNTHVPYYREVIRAAGFSEEMKSFRRAQFGQFIEDHGLRGKRIIEVGCGRGEFLSLLAEFDVEASGIEYGEKSVAECAGLGLQVTQEFIDDETQVVSGAPFDGFLMLAFLEHLPKPVKTLRAIRANLAPGAVGIVEVPNFDMIVHDKLFSEFMTDHLLYFTADTLAHTLETSGFEVQDIQPVWKDYILSATVKSRTPMNLSALQDQETKIRREVEGYLGAHRNVAIWGAGHQSFAVINILGLGGRVKYVLDSAPFKQGKFTPASHIPIVAPSALKSDPADAVLVMAASYSDEVARTIRRDYGQMPVAILREHGLEAVA